MTFRSVGVIDSKEILNALLILDEKSLKRGEDVNIRSCDVPIRIFVASESLV